MSAYTELREFLSKLEERYEISEIYRILEIEKDVYKTKQKAIEIRQRLQNIPEAGELLDLFTIEDYIEEEHEYSFDIYIRASFNDEVFFSMEFTEEDGIVRDAKTDLVYNNKIHHVFETEEETVESILEVLKILRLSNVTVGTVITFLESMCPYKLHRLKFTEEQLGKCIPITTKSARSTLPRPNNEEDNSPPKKIQKTK